jgi:PIN domain nuclease of toxin-antitoxin system
VRLLLDTNAVAWLLGDVSLLSQAAREAVAAQDAELLVSAASPWEMAIKYHSGKWPDVGPVIGSWDASLARAGVHEIPILGGVGIAAGTVEWGHRDPFDRLIAAQAIESRAALVSADPVFDAFPAVARLW